jgi:hypothetical protein
MANRTVGPTNRRAFRARVVTPAIRTPDAPPTPAASYAQPEIDQLRALMGTYGLPLNSEDVANRVAGAMDISGMQRQAARALDAYHGAAAEPVPIATPSVPPMVAGPAMLGSDLASLMSRGQVGGDVTGALVQQQTFNQQQILEKRKENLQMLLKQYENDAEAARQMGMEKERTKALALMNTTLRSMEQVSQSLTDLLGRGIAARGGIREAEINANRPLSRGMYGVGFDDAGLMLMPYYKQKMRDTLVSAKNSKPDQRSASRAAIMDFANQRLSGETIQQFYARLKSIPDPWDTNYEGGIRFGPAGEMLLGMQGVAGRAVPKPLFTEAQISGMLDDWFSPAELKAAGVD